MLGQPNKSCLEAMHAGLPREVVGIEGDAMAANPRTRVEGHEPEGFGGGRFDHFPDIDVERVTELGDLVDQRDVDA
ncbi:hypothetical protein D3C86_2058530 [compost metagenome]